MTEAGRRRRLVARTAIALLALGAATGARATCTATVSGNHIFALSGDSCPYASGAYNATTLIPVAPANTIVGLFANGGTITAADEATSISVTASVVSTPMAPRTSYAVWSDGPGSMINFFTPSGAAVPVTVSTSNSGTFGFYASGGGTIGSSTMTPEVAGVTTTASGANGVYAVGAGSTITLELLEPTAPALATIVTTGLDAPGAVAQSGGSVVLTGTGGSVLTEGDGSPGLAARGLATDTVPTSISATGITITTQGDADIFGIRSDGLDVAGAKATGTLTDVAIETSGTSAYGIVAEVSGTVTLNGAIMVTTTNDNSNGLFAKGGGTIDGSNASITVITDGENAIGAYASGTAPPATPGATPGPASTITIGGVASITTNGADAAGVQADKGGQVNLNGGSTKTPNTVTTFADDSIGLYAASAGVINVNGVTTISTGATGETPSGASAYGVNADGLNSKVNLNAATTVTTNGTGAFGTTAYGLYASNGGTIDGSLAPSVGVTTYGDGAIGVYASGTAPSPSTTASTITIGGVATIVTNGGVATIDIDDTEVNVPAAGVRADNGGQVTLSGGGSVTTNGAAAPGVIASGAGSLVTLNGAGLLTVTTIADGSIGLQAASGGVIDSTGPLTISTGATGETPSGASAYGVNADGLSSKVTLSGATTVTTNWTGASSPAFGLYATNGGTIDGSLSPSVGVTTYGTGAVGVYAHGTGTAGDTVTASTITITGASVVTNGASAIGVLADEGGLVTVNGGSVTTNGATVGEAAAIGVEATGVGSEVDLKGATTTTTNATGDDGSGAYGLYALGGAKIDGSAATSVGVTTFGTGAVGVYASGSGTVSGTVTPSTITIVGAKVITNGATATGVLADGGALATVTGGSVTTNGATAIGVEANGTLSEVDLKGAITVATGTTAATGAAYGLYAVDGGTIDGSTATSVGVTTSGTGAIGVYAHGTDEADAASTISIAGANVVTNGGSATGVLADFGGLATVTGGSVTTHGLDSPGVVASGTDSRADLAGTTSVSTTNNGGIGLYATLGGVVTETGSTTVMTSGTTSTTTGLGAYGVNADGTGSQVNLAAATITTSGVGATGIYASDVNATGQGGAIKVSGALGVTTGSGTGSAANGAWAQSAGSTIALNGASTFTINGGAFALFASQGGAISTGSTLGVTINGGAGAGGVEASAPPSPSCTSPPCPTITLGGATTIQLNGASNTGLLATTGGLITTEALTSITVSGATSTGVQATAGTVTATGALNVTTSQASSVAFALAGASPSIVASGGGTVSAAGNAINFIGATSAVATFDNFNFTSGGDLIFADPSTATINFNNTTANANGGNLLNATNGSAITFNANASTLTGAIQTDSTSTTNVSLTNNTSWTMTGSSTVTSLNLSNSSVTFSPSGGFKTLTVGSLVGGTGANVTLNTQLAGSLTDQIIINGGSATGTTLLTIKNASPNNAAAATTLPVVVTTNGGTTTTTAFKLASPVTAGGFNYTLSEDPSSDDWYLTGSPVSSPENSITAASIQNSINTLAQAQFNNMVTTRLLGSLLLGANEQVSGCDCGGGFAGVGSFSLGSHGRWALSDSLTLLAGVSWNSFYQDGTNVSASPIVAASLRYDPSNWGTSRPFVEFGAAASPYTSASYTRYYNNGFLPAMGVGSAIDRGLAVFGRVGWVARLTPVDEGAVFADLVRGWQEQGGYTEVSTAVNPFPATVSNGVDREDVVRLGGQYTHLFFGNLEANVNGAVAHGFDSSFGSQVSVLNFGSVTPFPILTSTWVEFGGRLGYRFSRELVVDAYALGTLGGEVGRTLHVGLGARYAF